MEKIIDATNLLLGRMCTRIAKMALLGSEEIAIINCEKAVISGRRSEIIGRYKHRKERTDTFKGPYVPRRPDRIVKRTMRGMLPYKQHKGLIAFKRIKCYEGVPEQFSGQKFETIEGADIKNSNVLKYISIGELAKEL